MGPSHWDTELRELPLAAAHQLHSKNTRKNTRKKRAQPKLRVHVQTED